LTSEETNSNDSYIIWTYDTGCSEHITNNKNVLKNFRNERIQMRCANNSICEFQGIGTFEETINNEIIRLDNVYYSKRINKNLLSGFKLSRNGYSSEINKTSLILNKTDDITDKEKIIGQFNVDEFKIARIPIKLKVPSISSVTNNKNELDDYSKTLWHICLGHFYHNNLSQYLELHNVKKHKYLNCKISKLKRLPHNGIPPTASGILETIHSDQIGPICITSGTGKKFILTFIDEFSRKTWIFLLKRKRDVPNTFIQIFKTISNRFNCNIKFFKTDNRLEFKNKKLKNCKMSLWSRL